MTTTGPIPARVVIRQATPDEWDAAGEITVAGYVNDGFLRPTDDYAKVLRDAAARAAKAQLWVAADPEDGRLLGTVTFCPRNSPYREVASADEGEFRMLAVDPAAQGRGVGRALVRHCIQLSRAESFEAIVLSTLPTMSRAHSLYLSLGFVRDHGRDFSPVEGVRLWVFRLGLR